MGIRLISSAVASALAIGVLLLHNTVVFPIAIAAVSMILMFELFRAAGCLRYRLSAGIAFLYGGVLPFLVYFGKSAYCQKESSEVIDNTSLREIVQLLESGDCITDIVGVGSRIRYQHTDTIP